MQQKINIQQLSGEISLRNGCSQSTADQFLKELFAIVTEELKNSKRVTIAGLGEFKRDKDDPNAVHFIADKFLCEQLNQPFSCFEPIELADDISEEDLFIKTDEHSVDEDTIETIHLKDEDAVSSKDEDLDVHEIEEKQELQEDKESILVLDDIEDNGNENSYDEEKVEEESIDAITDHNPVIVCENNISDRQSSNSYKIIVFFVIGVLLGFVAGYITKDILFSNVKIDTQIIPDTISQAEQMTNVVDSTINDAKIVEGESLTLADTVAVVVDKITSTRYLTTMARHHYGDMNFWVYIYEENSDKLDHPNKIKPGTEVVIPPKEKYNINVFDTLSIEIAKEKAKEIYAKYR